MSYQIHPCALPNDVAAELAAAEEAARQEARARIVAAVREKAGEAVAAAGADAAVPDGAAPDDARGGFGRGWIPASRDIGLPGEGGGGAFLPGTGRGPTGGGGGARSDCLERAVAHGLHVPLHHALHGPPPPAGEEPAPRTERSIDFTAPRRALFLHHLAEQGNVRVAASLARVSPTSAYLARRRDAVFRAGWDASLVQSREHAMQVLANRALEGIREEVWHRGELVGHRVRHDSRLLLAHLGRLDARCQDARAVARAERFDELLALVAGEDCGWALRDDRKGAGDEILPLTRTDHSNRAAGMAYGGRPYDEPDEIDHDELVARDLAEAEWDEWGTRVDAVNDALEAGEEPVVAAPGAAAPEPEPLDDVPPYEVKSLYGVPPRAAGRGREYFARTVCGSSTWSPAARFSGDRAKSRRDRAGGEAALAAPSPRMTEAEPVGGFM